jgi:predicted nucleic acid-binding protein
MNARSFLVTNIFVYCFDTSAPQKGRRAEELIYEALATKQGVISYQVMQEFTAVVRRFRIPMRFEDIEDYCQTTLLPLLTVYFTPELYWRALNLARRDQLSWYDALIVAAALQSGCKVLYSEDLQRGRRFGELVVENPFL